MSDCADENIDSYRSTNKTAFIVGYTGESGKELVKLLAVNRIFSKVTHIGRRTVEYDDDVLKEANLEQKLVDFDKLEESAHVFKGHDVGYCCLGTTMKKAGSEENFVKVDRDYVLKTAELAKTGGVEDFHLISAQGANPNSSMFILRLKGQVEEAVRDMNFDRLSVYRPGVLMCDREESRPTDWMMRKMLAPLEYIAPGLLTTPTSTLAKDMMHVTVSPITEHSNVFDGKTIQRLSQVQMDKDLENTKR